MSDLPLQVWHVLQNSQNFQFDGWHHSRCYIHTTTSQSSSSSRYTILPAHHDPTQDFNQVLSHVLIPLIHGLPIWGLLNSLSWSNLSLRERAFLYGKAQSIIVSSYQEVSYSRLFEYQWFVVNHLFIRLLSESDLRWMSVGIRKKHSLNSTGVIPI